MPAFKAPGLRWTCRLAVLAAAYWAGGRLGLMLPYIGSHVSLIWLPTGIAMAGLLRWELSLWPALWLGAFGVNLSVGSEPLLAAGIACGNAAGPWLAARTLRQLKLDCMLPTRRDQLLYVGVGALGGMAVNATNGALQLWLAGLLASADLAEAWTVWWLGDAMGALVLGLPLLTARRQPWREMLRGPRSAELSWAFILALGLGWLVFLRQGEASPASPLLYVPFLVLCHLAVRGEPSIASCTALLLSAQAVWATAQGRGPFQTGDVHGSLTLLWGYIATVTIITALASALTSELRNSERRLRQMFETNRSVKLIIDPASGRIEDANQAACDFYGYERARLLGLRIGDINTAAPHEIEAEMQRARQESRLYFNFCHRLASGETRDVEVYSGPISTSRGERLYSIIHDVTKRREFEAELRKFQLFSKHASDAHLLVDQQARICYANPLACRRLGYSEAELLRLSVPDIDTRVTVAMVQAHFEQCRQGTLPAFESVHRARDGSTFPVEVSSTPINFKGEWMLFATCRDITERKDAEAQLRLAASVFSHAHECVVICDLRQRIVDTNPMFTEITGYTREEVHGKSPGILGSGRHDAAFYQAMWQAIGATGFWEGEIWNRRKDGSIYPALLNISSVYDARGQVSHYIGVSTDISRFKEHQAQLEFLAHYDALTRLPNRALLSDRMAVAVAQARRGGTRVAVCYLDLDGFKAINDELGHQAGDAVLVEVAHRLQREVRAGDTVARLGGDEFVLLLGSIQAPAECEHVITRVLQALAAPIRVQGRERRVSGSIGYTLFPDDDGDPDTLLRHADQAMYRVKQAGKNSLQCFDAALV